MVFFSLERYSTSSPSPTSKAKSILSWISELDDNPGSIEVDSSSLIPSAQSKSIFSPKPLQSNPNLCTRFAPSFPPTKQVLGKRKSYAMDPPEQSGHQDSPRRTGRTRSPTKKVLDNVAAMSSSSAMDNTNLVFAQPPGIPFRTQSPVKSKQTPRKSKQDLRSTPKTPTRGRTVNIEDDDDDYDNETENNVLSDLPPITFDPSTKTSTRTRSTSPIKERAEMRFFDPPIVFLDIGSSDHPQTITDFTLRFRPTILGISVIPEYVKSLVNDADKSANSPADFNFGQLPDSHAGIQRLWKIVQKLHKATNKLCENGGYEGNWRELVVNPLLELAIEHFGLEDQVIVSNVDMVRIDPLELRPSNPMHGNQKVQIKKIDTILALELPTDRVDNAFAKWPKPRRSFMQCTMTHFCRSPIVLNIEVKKMAGDDPLGQLGIWSAAGFQKRKIEGDEKEGIPRISMPGLAIVGDRWELYVAYRHEDGRVVLAGPMNVGSTRSYLGIFQIINCLKVLTDWGLNEYNKWLEEVVWKRLERGPNWQGDEKGEEGEKDEEEREDEEEDD